MLSWRAMWKDWGFAQHNFAQAKRFADLAAKEQDENDRTGHIRASIVFSQLTFEAHFSEVVRGYIQANIKTIDQNNLAKVQKGMKKWIGIERCLKKWPHLLTGKPLDESGGLYKAFNEVREYRNALVHSKITDRLPSSGLTAQEFETVDRAQNATDIAAGMIGLISDHFGFDRPEWI